MKQTGKRRLKSTLSIVLAMAMVCSVIPYWPSDIFSLEAKAATTENNATSLLSEWKTSGTDNLDISEADDGDGTKVLILDQKSQGSSMAGSYETASILEFAPEDTTFTSGYTISADVKVTDVYKANNSSGIGIGDTVESQNQSYYAYAAYRASGNAKAVYNKADGTYGSTDIGSAATVTAGTQYTVGFQKTDSSYAVTWKDSDSLNLAKTINKNNVNSVFFDSTETNGSAPGIILEGVGLKSEICRSKIRTGQYSMI